MLSILRTQVDSFIHKRASSQTLQELNPLLLDGEVVYETDTGFSKLGDGFHLWNDLPYSSSPIQSQDINEAVLESLVNLNIVFDGGEIN